MTFLLNSPALKWFTVNMTQTFYFSVGTEVRPGLPGGGMTQIRIKSVISFSSFSLFSAKGQTLNILDFAGCIVLVATTQVCHYSRKAAIVNM
jgi:hypothetical protein